MAFSIIFFIGWVCIATFYAMKKQFSKLENSALLFCIFILNVNWSWIIYDELKFITYSKLPLNYTAYVIHRSLIIPILVVIGINSIPRNTTMTKKVMGILISSFVLILIKMVLLRFNVVNFEKWNFIFDYLYYVLLHSLGYFVLQCYHSFVLKGVKN